MKATIVGCVVHKLFRNLYKHKHVQTSEKSSVYC